MNSVFKKSKEISLKIEKFLNIISDSLLLFEKGIDYYLSGEDAEFNKTFERICALESDADSLENEIKISLYQFMLLPDMRADVLSLVKSLDNIIDITEEVIKDFKIQKPNIPREFHKDIGDMTSNSIKAAESLLLATRAFFTEVHMVSAHNNKVKFFEHETDLLEDKLYDMIFNGGVIHDLATKLQLKFFVCKIADIADEAELIKDKLAIFTIKREI